MNRVNYTNAPLVIGATGGSGTRVIARICQRLGYYMGSEYNRSIDSLDFEPFYDKWIDTSLTPKALNLSDEQSKARFLDFHGCIQKHRKGMSDQSIKWGWKNSRSMFFLPFFHTLYPAMKFIHIVRDGRDMAFSEKVSKLLRYAKFFSNDTWDSMLIPHRSILFWKATNIAIASFGESRMPGNYLKIRFEDLCENPYGIVKILLKFLQIPNVDPAMLSSEIRRPPSIGRWHAFPIDIIDELEQVGGDALKKFGYLH